MHTYVVIFTLLTFSSVAVSAGLQNALNVPNRTADIHQVLPNSCVIVMQFDGEKRLENNLDFSPTRLTCFLRKKKFSYFKPSNTSSLVGKTFSDITEYG